MAEYDLLTIWRIQAPLEEVYAAIHDSPAWPDWWPAVREVKAVAAGDADGINSVWRYSWQGSLPYRLVFEVLIARIEKLVRIEGIARGALAGTGCWQFAREGLISIVRYEWHVRTTRWWMNLLAPVLRSMFIRNHGIVMSQGARGLAHMLKSSLISEETTELTSSPGLPPAASPLHPWRFDPAMVIVAGVVAGSVATVVQMLLWWLSAVPLAETLFRDARLTAAIVMGTVVLPPPSTPRWDILLIATLIHFTLSIVYAVIPTLWARHLTAARGLLVGAFYGLVIYGMNLYGFTGWFPWFDVSRGWITLVAHLAFGATLVEACRVYGADKGLFQGCHKGDFRDAGQGF